MQPTPSALSESPSTIGVVARSSFLRRFLEGIRDLCRDGTFLWIGIAALAFHFAYAWPYAAPLVVVYLFALFQLAGKGTSRRRFYSGLAVGFLLASVRLTFFWNIFSGGAVALWYVFALWIGFFVFLAGFCLDRFGRQWGWLFLPFLWTGLEWFRSEGYWLRFSWLSPGYAFSEVPGFSPISLLGVYGTGFVLACMVALSSWRFLSSKIQGAAILAIGPALLLSVSAATHAPNAATGREIHVAGIQLEFPSPPEVIESLNRLVKDSPETELIVLSEYTFMDSLPDSLREWCRRNQRYLIVGAEDFLQDKQYFNTAFVIGPDGEIVFRQAKSMPIQFFKDGMPAPGQALWNSPWGKLGICICYDLSYRTVTDRLVVMGAQALIVPTMDARDWGEAQHVLHARVAPVRAAEYGLPIFRLASSGISQHVVSSGEVLASTPCFAQGAVLRQVLRLAPSRRVPLDAWLVPVTLVLSAATLGMVLWERFARGRRHLRLN